MWRNNSADYYSSSWMGILCTVYLNCYNYCIVTECMHIYYVRRDLSSCSYWYSVQSVLIQNIQQHFNKNTTSSSINPSQPHRRISIQQIHNTYGHDRQRHICIIGLVCLETGSYCYTVRPHDDDDDDTWWLETPPRGSAPRGCQ